MQVLSGKDRELMKMMGVLFHLLQDILTELLARERDFSVVTFGVKVTLYIISRVIFVRWWTRRVTKRRTLLDYDSYFHTNRLSPFAA